MRDGVLPPTINVTGRPECDLIMFLISTAYEHRTRSRRTARVRQTKNSALVLRKVSQAIRRIAGPAMHNFDHLIRIRCVYAVRGCRSANLREEAERTHVACEQDPSLVWELVSISTAAARYLVFLTARRDSVEDWVGDVGSCP